jgi:signal transduction histidine kinase
MVCPMLFSTLGFRPAAVLTTVAILLSPASAIANDGLRGPTLHILLPMTAILVVFGVLSGKFILHVIEESRGRADLIAELEESRAEVARLSREAGTAAERERLAREIHDTLAQGFTSIVTLAEAIKSELDSDPAAARRHVELTARTARENLAEARTMVAALAPADLTAGSLADAVRRQADRLADETGLTVRYEVDGALPAFGMAGEVVLLRGAQEALNNVRRHAGASAVAVRLSVVDGSVRLSVRDDGVGFDPDGVSGFGLRGMRSRAEQVGGTLSVRSGPSGTELTLEVPA